MDQEMISIPVAQLTELLDIRREYFKVCDIFKIPTLLRGQYWVGNGIVDRIHTYLTAYTIKETMAKKETGASFLNDADRLQKENIHDPVQL